MSLANPELEAELLGQLLFDNKLVEAVADHVDAAAFSVSVHGRIFETILSEVHQGNLANAVTLKPYFDGDEQINAMGGTVYLMQLSALASLNSIVDLAKQVSRLARRRAMQEGLHAASLDCSDMDVSLAAIMDRADAALSEQSKETIHQPTGADCIGELLAGFDSKVKGVKCGSIPPLDDLLGPIKPKQLVILAARPGMGKTATAISYAQGAAQLGHGVLFVSLEMSSTELAGRMVSDLCHDQEIDLPYNAVRDGTLNRAQRDWIGRAREFAGELPFQVVDTGSLTVSRLSMLVRSHQRRMKAKGQELQLVVIDYLQLLQGDRRASAYERISEISMGLKALAKDTGVGIMALAQLSRAVEQREDKRPMLSDLRDSGQIEQDADAVLFLLREEYYLWQEQREPHDPKFGDWQVAMADARNRIEFILAKRRNGTTGSAMGSFHGAYQAVRG